MKKKKILIDLSVLKNPYCGLGQVALNYGNYFKQNHIASQANYELYLLLPQRLIGKFGSEVRYINSSNFFYKNIPLLVSLLHPSIDVWHSIHQITRKRPFYRRTKYVLTIHDYNYVYEKAQEEDQTFLQKYL